MITTAEIQAATTPESNSEEQERYHKVGLIMLPDLQHASAWGKLIHVDMGVLYRDPTDSYKLKLADANSATAAVRTMKFGEVGLGIAVASGKLKEGDMIKIQKGLAIVTSPGSITSKVFSLAGLGLTKAIEDGHIKPGDSIVVQGDSIIIKTAPLPVTSAKAPVLQ